MTFPISTEGKATFCGSMRSSGGKRSGSLCSAASATTASCILASIHLSSSLSSSTSAAFLGPEVRFAQYLKNTQREKQLQKKSPSAKWPHGQMTKSASSSEMGVCTVNGPKQYS